MSSHDQKIIAGRYKVEKLLGSGLSGDVYAVTDGREKKALKLLKPVQMKISREEANKNFKSEFSILAELNHPGIARILDFGIDKTRNRNYFTSELIEGCDFFRATENQRVEVIEELAVQVLRALNYLHSRDIYHFDIKPQNILVEEKNGKLRAKIIDFGLASYRPENRDNKSVGTPAYMAPEVMSRKARDGRADLYSFGVVIYKALTRENPLASSNVHETMERHRSFIPPPPSEINSKVPKYFDHILKRLLEKIPSDRYPHGAAVIRGINFLANKKYEIETIDTRFSYLPEKGSLVGRHKELEIFKALFEMIFSQNAANPSRLIIVEGKLGTGKSRLLQEFKYHSQLNNVHVHTWQSYQQEKAEPPFCLIIDETEGIGPDKVNLLLHKYAHEKILILWATEKAPSGWSHSETVTLHNFSEKELARYLTTVTGLEDTPKKLLKEIHHRSEGNPLFVTELLKTMLANNLLLDSSGRWISSTFEDIGIDFEKIQVSKTLSGLLKKKYDSLGEDERKILEWLAVFNRPLSLEPIRILSGIAHPQSSILYLTKEDFIERTAKEHHYFFNNVLLRDVIYESLSEEIRQKMHDEAAEFLEGQEEYQEEFLYHMGHGSHDEHAVESLESLGGRYLQEEKFSSAIKILEKAWERAKKMPIDTQVEVETSLAECTVAGRDYKKAISHYQHLKDIFDNDPERSRTFVDNRIQIYEKLGDLHAKLDLYDNALKLFDTALDWLSDVQDNRVTRMRIQNHIGNVCMKSGKVDAAEKIFRESYNEWESGFSLEEKKQVTNNLLVDVLVLKKDYEPAIKQIEKVSAFFEEMGDRYLMSRAAYVKGDLNFKLMLNVVGAERSEYKEKALKSFERSLKFAKGIEAQDMMLRAYNGIGNLHYHERELDKSSGDYQRALALARKLEDFQTAAAISMNLGNIFKIQKNHRDAYAYFVYSMNTLENLEHKSSYNWLHLYNCQVEIAETYREMGEFSKAEEILDKAELLVHSQKHLASYEFYMWLERTRVYHKQGKKALCDEALKKASALAREGVEIEELKKFQDVIKTEDVSGVPKKIPTIKTSWVFKTMKDEKKDISQAELETILHINKFINSERDLDHLLKMVLNYALELSGAESGMVLLLNENNELEVKASVNTTVSQELTRISTSIARQALESGEVVISPDALADGRFGSQESVILNDLKSVLCLPLKSRNKTIGVLYLDNRQQTNAFDNIHLLILNAYGDQVGIALENAGLFTRYQDTQKTLENQLEKTTGELREVKEILKSETSAYMTKYSYSQIIAKSKPMQEIFKVLDKVTETNLSVYLHGASGTGKELIARAIHFNNPQRSPKRFVAINCGAIPANLIESELFGYKAGSFTGANKDKKGLFEEANGGTLFLDEVGELEMALQVKLLRVLQEGDVMRIGDVKPVRVDVRIVCASHKHLEEMVKQEKFREDLFYRLCQIKVHLPPLVERREDIPLLVDHFIESFRKENNVKEKIKLTPSLMKVFFHYQWPGNIRELENTIQVTCALREGNILDVSSLPQNFGVSPSSAQTPSSVMSIVRPQTPEVKETAANIPIDEKNYFDSRKTWGQYEIVIIAKCFEANNFKKGITAQTLGVSSSTLYNKIKEHHLEDRTNPVYSDSFVCQAGKTLKEYIPVIFNAALENANGHPYAAIRQLGVSQGYFYKVMKKEQAGVA